MLTGDAAKDIYFDVILPPVINSTYITNLTRRFQHQFETALEYVSLWRDLDGAQHPLSAERVARRDGNSYEAIFEWLRTELGVKKIFRILVEDLVPYPHSDEAIKDSLKPFGVEIWDWRKLDISSRTIFDAAPETRELYLQCSGNKATLQSWACQGGLEKLRQVRIFIFLWTAG